MWGRIYPHVVLIILANIIFKVSCKGTSSLTFLIDDTGSMSDDINGVRHSVDTISDIVFNEKSSLIDNMVLVTFNDPDAQVRVVTNNRYTFKRTLGAVYAHNIINRDCWEPSMRGLLLALETSNSNSFIYVFTDAPAKDYRDSPYVKDLCQKKQSKINFVLTGRCNDMYDAKAFDVYYEIAQACSGQAFDVSKTNVKEVLNILKETIIGNKTVISTQIIPAGVKKDIPFTIDDHTDYAIVSVSGRNVYLDVKGPSAYLEKIMWNANGKVVKLSNATPGTYVATVMGQTKTSVVIVGRTDFFFTHGFSGLKPKSLGDTALQPVADTNVHLSISVTDDHHTVQIVSAQILDMHENPLRVPMPLTEVSKDFYVTTPFVSPSQRFKLVVHGIVKATGQPIKRIVRIPITPAAPPKILPTNTKPTVEIAEGRTTEIEYNSTAQFTCKVVAFPAPKIEWINMNGGRMPSKMALVEFPYKYISYMEISNAVKGDRYKCYATNDVGRAENTINVIVKEPFTVTSPLPGVTKFVYGREGNIICGVTSRLPMDIHWYYANELTGQSSEIVTSDKYEISASRTQLKIKKMDMDLVGRYSCKVSLTNKKDVQKQFFTRVKIDGLIPPKVQGATELKIIKGKTAVFDCKVVSGVPAPKLTWQFGSKSGSTFTPISSESVLRLTNVEDKHEGKYKCVAENIVGKDEHVTTLFVQEVPKIRTGSSVVYQATEGDALLKIPCAATGVPKPVIIWKLNGHSIIPSSKYSIEEGTLLIRDPKVTDTNSYTCEAKNEAASASATFKAYIRQAPHVSGVATKKVRIGTRATIDCSVDKGEPKPTITWQFMANSSSTFLRIPGSDKVLPILRVETRHAGRYKCVAQNILGSSEHITTLDVQEPPTLVSSTSTVYKSIEGDASLKIPCVATGLPKPNITWKLNGRVINPGAKFSVVDGALIIRDPKVTDTNSYTCEAMNEVGVVRATFRAYIRQLPKLSGVASKNVRLGTPASIDCMIVKGEPKPTITWLFKDASASKYVPIAGSETTLRIPTAEKKHTGSYKCVAQNTVGTDEHVTALIVEYAPGIITNSSIIEGIEGDQALRVPCHVTGVPKPVITWKLKGATITLNSKYSIEDGALVIMNPTIKDSSSYTCEAKNHISTVGATFQAVVETVPKNFGTEHFVYLLEGATKKINCEAFKSKSQSVKWFITKVRPRTPDPSLSTTPSSRDTATSKVTTEPSTTPRTITKDARNKEPYMQITDASDSENDGNYTCRVSDKHGNTQTHTYVVDVGNKPQFTSDATSISNWQGEITDIKLNCEVQSNAKPVPTVEWKFNGKALTDLNSAGLGHYTCNVTNVHGSIQKTFDVKSSECLISRNLGNAQYMPLMLNGKSWHKLQNTKHYIRVEQEVQIMLSCPSQTTPNAFKKFPKKSTLEAFCYKEDSFLVEGKLYKLSDLQCTNTIQPSVIRKKVKCSTATSELIRVGYNVPDFLEAYEVCFDHAKHMPSYTRIIMTDTNNNGLSAGYSWFNYPGIDSAKTNRGFTCKDTSSTCCYSKSQLVNAIDFNDGPAKKSTFIDPLNAVPVWLPCNTSRPSWEGINEMVRSQLSVYTDIITWSGTHTLQEKNGAIIPRYLWKVIRLDDEIVAIVHVNDPAPVAKDIKCKTQAICDTYEDWLLIDSDKYTYCCSLTDFFSSFNIHSTDIGEPIDSVLDKIEIV